MKYEITKENPIFQEGIRLRESFICNPESGSIQFTTGDVIVLPKKTFKEWLENGYIKKFEKKEFTKSDMLDFGFKCSPTEAKNQVETIFDKHYNSLLKLKK